MSQNGTGWGPPQIPNGNQSAVTASESGGRNVGRWVLLGVVGLALIGALAWFALGRDDDVASEPERAVVTVPEVSETTASTQTTARPAPTTSTSTTSAPTTTVPVPETTEPGTVDETTPAVPTLPASPGERPTPPFEVAEWVDFGEFNLAVPMGFDWEIEYDPDLDVSILFLEVSDSPTLRFRFFDHPTNLDETVGAAGLCAAYNKPLVQELGAPLEELAALPISFSGDVDVVVCGALGAADDGVVYDYSWTSYFDLENNGGVIMQQRTDWDAYQADESAFSAVGDYFVCELGYQTGAVLEIC